MILRLDDRQRHVWAFLAGQALLSASVLVWAAGVSWPHLAEMVFFALVCGQAGIVGVVSRHERLSLAGQGAVVCAGTTVLLVLLGVNTFRDYGSWVAPALEFVLLMHLFLVMVPAFTVWAVLTGWRAVLRREAVRRVFEQNGDVQFSLRHILAAMLLLAALLAAARVTVERLGESGEIVTMLLFGIASAGSTLIIAWLSLTAGWTMPRLLVASAALLLIALGPPAVFGLLGVPFRTEDVLLWVTMLGFQAIPAAATYEIAGLVGYRIALREPQVIKSAADTMMEATRSV